MKLKIIGMGMDRYLVAKDKKTYTPGEPVAIYRDGKWFVHDEMSLGVVYKFTLWDDYDGSAEPILKDVPEFVINHLKGSD